MKKITTTLVATAAAAALIPSSASAKTVICKYGTYNEPRNEMVVGRLRAVNLPKKTSGYAPACLVAESVAYLVASKYNGFPKTVHPRGARWDGGRYSCKYEEREGEYNPYMVVACTSRAKRL